MRDRDRFWWLLILAAVACWVAAVVIPYNFMQTAPTPAENQFVTNDEYREWIVWSVVFGMAFLSIGVICILMAVRARRRHDLRVAAFMGDERAMSAANIRTDATGVPDVAARPLELMWRTSRVTGFFYAVILIVQSLGVLLTGGLTLFAFVNSLVRPTHPLTLWEVVPNIAGAVALAAILVGLILLIVRAAPFLFGRPFGVTATDTGIDARTEFGTRIHVDWDAVRLLEVAGADANAARRFYLYALGKRIGWAEYMVRFGADYAPADIPSSEMTLRQNALLNLTVARTGLTLRTLAKTLQKRPTSSGELRRPTSVSIQLVCAMILLGIVAVDYSIPISPIPWLKWVSTGALALAVLCTIFSAMRAAFARSASLAHATPPSAGAPSLDVPGLAYALSWRPSLGRRVVLIALGMGLAISLVPAVLLLLLALGIALPGYQPHILHGDGGDFTVLGCLGLAMVHGLVGILGVGLVYGGAITATARIRADQDGLAIITGPRERVMAWSSVQEISWGTGRDGQYAYLVKGTVPTLQISWPSGAQSANADSPIDGAVPIGPDELAALIVAQINKPIQVREGK